MPRGSQKGRSHGALGLQGQQPLWERSSSFCSDPLSAQGCFGGRHKGQRGRLLVPIGQFEKSRRRTLVFFCILGCMGSPVLVLLGCGSVRCLAPGRVGVTCLDYEASRGFPGAVGVLSSQAGEVWLLLQSSKSSDAHPVVSTHIPGSRGPPQAWTSHGRATSMLPLPEVSLQHHACAYFLQQQHISTKKV